MLNLDNETKVSLRANAALLAHILADESAEPALEKLDIDAFMSQLEKLKQVMKDPVSDTDLQRAGMMDWKMQMLQYLIPDGIDRDADPIILARQKTRLVKALMSIPDANCFLALMQRFVDINECETATLPRPGRKDDARCRRHKPTDEDLNSAITFMRLPARIRYIRDGDSKLKEELCGKTLDYLNHRRIYIPEDFERLTTTDMLLDSDIDAYITRQIIVTRAYKEHIKPEKYRQIT